MTRQGLLEALSLKVKMSNLMEVLASEATQDPSKLLMEICSGAAEREQAHVDRNIARKLTPAERCENKEKKLLDDPNSLENFVCVQDQGLISPPNTGCAVKLNEKVWKVDAEKGKTRLLQLATRKSLARIQIALLTAVLVWQDSAAKKVFVDAGFSTLLPSGYQLLGGTVPIQ
ncbi:hypothetical protein OPV22_020153 [Ensete ventricosum]|uniref:Pre-mRNA-splicing factor 3 domain-containing protein n=1 Tax=Ensete ventricosum TaxID=4639 RepID=A0AAV8QDK0_ENSVE|nr:hypothetical protein OPV22_020153 [Ensete ventricosum]